MQAVIVNGNPGFERTRLQAAPSIHESGVGKTGKGTASAVPQEQRGDGALAPEVACYISDLMPTTAHIDLTWGMGFDLYPLQTIESKKLYYAKSIAEKWLTVFTHDAKMPWAYVEKDELGKMVARGA
jgi:hypothetical protein